jgi:hypothetical protein
MAWRFGSHVGTCAAGKDAPAALSAVTPPNAMRTPAPDRLRRDYPRLPSASLCRISSQSRRNACRNPASVSRPPGKDTRQVDEGTAGAVIT